MSQFFGSGAKTTPKSRLLSQKFFFLTGSSFKNIHNSQDSSISRNQDHIFYVMKKNISRKSRLVDTLVVSGAKTSRALKLE